MTDLSDSGKLTYKAKHKIRFVTAASLFDGHDASINIMRRILQSSGAEVIHLGHNRSVDEGEKTRLVASIGRKQAVILRNHGLLAWGPSVPQAFLTLWTLQRACDVQIAAAAAGAIYPVRPEAIAVSVRESGQGEKRTCEDVFAAMQRLVDARDPSYRD